MKKRKKPFSQTAYTGTQVEAEHTQEQIVKMLEQLGITHVRITKRGSDYEVEFLVKLRNNEGQRKVRINLPVNLELEDREMNKDRKKNIMFRVLFHHLKDKFVVIQRGLKEFEEEFLADLVIISNGEERRLGDVIVPQYKAQLKGAKVAVLNIN